MKTDDFEPKELANTCEEQMKASGWEKYKSAHAIQRTYKTLQEALKEYRENTDAFFFPEGNLKKALKEFLEEVEKVKGQDVKRKQEGRENWKFYLLIISAAVAVIGLIFKLAF